MSSFRNIAWKPEYHYVLTFPRPSGVCVVVALLSVVVLGVLTVILVMRIYGVTMATGRLGVVVVILRVIRSEIYYINVININMYM
jgi:hypothetical protein